MTSHENPYHSSGSEMGASEFSMWRAVFAFALSDHNVTQEELDLLNQYRHSARFSPGQLMILREDFIHPRDVNDMYRQITQPEHKHRFCVMARALAWCDGDLTSQEEAILKKVTCLGGGEDNDILMRSRAQSDLGDYYGQYEKIGMMGFVNSPHIVEMRV